MNDDRYPETWTATHLDTLSDGEIEGAWVRHDETRTRDGRPVWACTTVEGPFHPSAPPWCNEATVEVRTGASGRWRRIFKADGRAAWSHAGDWEAR